MTKSELIEVVAQETNLTKGRAELVINTIFESMVEALQRGEGIEIRGFGSFTVRQYKAYEGRNPRTGEPVHVAPKRLPFFKVGKDLRLRVNGQRTGKPPRRVESGEASDAVASSGSSSAGPVGASVGKPGPSSDAGTPDDVI